MLHHFCSTSTIFKSEPRIEHHSYFDSAVAVASDPCTLVRWIGIHKDTHFMMFFSIVHEYLIRISESGLISEDQSLCLRSLKFGFLHGSLMALTAWG
jgi:hypothetical protein